MRAIGRASVLAALLLTVILGRAQAQTFGEDGRPVLEEEQTFASEHFLIHYTLTGTDAIPTEDADEDGIPDFVRAVAAALENAYTVQVDEWGWASPPTDAGKGGDDRLDVYLIQLLVTGIAGFVSPTGGWIGDNPATPQIEREAAYSYMVLDNDYAEIYDFDPDLPPGSEQTFAEVVIAHEFNHMLQSGYNSSDPSIWLYEATATWTEAEIFGTGDQYALEYLPYVLKNPDYCVAANSGRGADGLRWYGMWLFIHHLSEQYGRDTVRTIWENMREDRALDALAVTLDQAGTSLDEEVRAFAVANLLRAYQNGDDLPTVRLEGDTQLGRFRPFDGVQPLGVDYIQLDLLEPLTIALFQQEAEMTLQVVALREDGNADVFGGTGEAVNVDLTGYEAAFILVHNAERTLDSCEFADYRISIAQAEEVDFEESTAITGVNFAEPIIGDVASEATGLLRIDRPFTTTSPDRTFSDRPEGIQVSFEPLVLDEIPGYEFDFASVRSAESYGTFAPLYAPGGDEAASYEYLHDEDWIRITQSVSPYDELEDWVFGEDYTPRGEIQTVAGVEVLVENFSREGQTWIVATLIAGDLFIVVDGSESEEVVLTVVEALLAEAGLTTDPALVTPTFIPPPLPSAGAPADPALEMTQLAQQNAAIAASQGVAAGMCMASLILIVGVFGVTLLMIRRIPSP